MAKVGRPPKYKSVKEIEGKIEDYFRQCEGEILKDDNGKPILNKWGKPVIVGKTPPTVTGLALALGFTNRLDLLRYQGKPEFCNAITRAKSRVEAYTETRLFDKEGSNGAQFSLRNNFKGWNGEISQQEENDTLKKAKELLSAIDSVIE